MKFEEFESGLWGKGYGIAAMNHYSIKGQRYTYCVVLSKDDEKAFKAEAENSEDVFKQIYELVEEYEKNNNF